MRDERLAAPINGGFASLSMILCDHKPNDWTWERDFAARFHFITYDRHGCWRSYPDLLDIHDVRARSSAAGLATGTSVPGELGQGARITTPACILDVERFYAALYEGVNRVRMEVSTIG